MGASARPGRGSGRGDLGREVLGDGNVANLPGPWRGSRGPAHPGRIESGTFPSAVARGRLTPMSLLLRDLQAFYLEHEHCGELDGGVEGNLV